MVQKTISKTVSAKFVSNFIVYTPEELMKKFKNDGFDMPSCQASHYILRAISEVPEIMSDYYNWLYIGKGINDYNEIQGRPLVVIENYPVEFIGQGEHRIINDDVFEGLFFHKIVEWIEANINLTDQESEALFNLTVSPFIDDILLLANNFEKMVFEV